MLGAFNTVYAALQGFLSRDYWEAVFIPVAVFAALHAFFAARLGYLPLRWSHVVTADNTVLARSATFIFLGLVLLGYLLRPLMPLFRGLLDGSLLPGPLQTLLLAERRDSLTPEQDRLRLALSQAVGLRNLAREFAQANGRLQRAYDAARNLGNVAGQPGRVAETEALATLLDRALKSGPPPTVGVVKQALDSMVRMLEVNNPALRALPPAAPNARQLLSMRADAAVNGLLDLTERAANEAEAAYDRLETRLRLSKAVDQPRPTTLGDARFLAERYAQDVYAVKFDFLWPRLILSLRTDTKDDAFLAAVDQGRTRCDFAILCFMLSLTVPVIWLPLLARAGQAPLFLVVGAAAPLLAGFLYRLATESQLALTDVIRATIDRHRLRVLKSFGQAPPHSRTEERLLWQRIAMAEDNSELAYLAYAPEAKS